MSEFQSFNKKETLAFISLFEANTKELEEPMIGFYCEGSMELEEATEMVSNGLVHEGVSVSGKRPNEEYWDSIFIHKEEDDNDYLITTGDMSNVSDQYATEPEEALKKAQKMLLAYITENS